MATISANELNQQASLSYVRGTYYVALLNTSSTFTSSVTYAQVTAAEVTAGLGGYARVSFNYTSGDLSAYNNGQPLAAKTINFVHNGSASSIQFTHIAILRLVSSTYTVVAIESIGQTAVLNSGRTARFTINLLHGA